MKHQQVLMEDFNMATVIIQADDDCVQTYQVDLSDGDETWYDHCLLDKGQHLLMNVWGDNELRVHIMPKR
jgi:hypothetical protein